MSRQRRPDSFGATSPDQPKARTRTKTNTNGKSEEQGDHHTPDREDKSEPVTTTDSSDASNTREASPAPRLRNDRQKKGAENTSVDDTVGRRKQRSEKNKDPNDYESADKPHKIPAPKRGTIHGKSKKQREEEENRASASGRASVSKNANNADENDKQDSEKSKQPSKKNDYETEEEPQHSVKSKSDKQPAPKRKSKKQKKTLNLDKEESLEGPSEAKSTSKPRRQHEPVKTDSSGASNTREASPAPSLRNDRQKKGAENTSVDDTLGSGKQRSENDKDPNNYESADKPHKIPAQKRGTIHGKSKKQREEENRASTSGKASVSKNANNADENSKQDSEKSKQQSKKNDYESEEEPQHTVKSKSDKQPAPKRKSKKQKKTLNLDKEESLEGPSEAKSTSKPRRQHEPVTKTDSSDASNTREASPAPSLRNDRQKKGAENTSVDDTLGSRKQRSENDKDPNNYESADKPHKIPAQIRGTIHGKSKKQREEENRASTSGKASVSKNANNADENGKQDSEKSKQQSKKNDYESEEEPQHTVKSKSDKQPAPKRKSKKQKKTLNLDKEESLEGPSEAKSTSKPRRQHELVTKTDSSDASNTREASPTPSLRNDRQKKGAENTSVDDTLGSSKQRSEKNKDPNDYESADKPHKIPAPKRGIIHNKSKKQREEENRASTSGRASVSKNANNADENDKQDSEKSKQQSKKNDYESEDEPQHSVKSKSDKQPAPKRKNKKQKKTLNLDKEGSLEGPSEAKSTLKPRRQHEPVIKTDSSDASNTREASPAPSLRNDRQKKGAENTRVNETMGKVLKATIDKLKIKKNERSQASGCVNDTMDKVIAHLKQNVTWCKYIERLPTGSYYENVKICEPDEFDVMLTIPVERVNIQNFDEAGAFYTVALKRNPNKHLLDRFLNEDKTIKASEMLHEFREAIKKAVKKLPNKDKIMIRRKKPRCPAVTLEIKIEENGKTISVDFVLGLKVHGSWPHFTKDGFKIENWLGKKEKTNMKRQPFYLVPKYKGKGNAEHNGVVAKDAWRISFSNVEKEILKRHGHSKTCCEDRNGQKCCRKECLKLLKYLLQKLKEDDSKSSKMSSFCSYHAKTTLLHACATRGPDSEWAYTQLADCFQQLLKDFLEHLRNRRLPNFFIPSHNLLHEASKRSCEFLANEIEFQHNNNFPIFL
ncbi:hypothetical protein QQF64_005672 [Cirrhinus molitorella]|uniref:Cyclic GMP-AMP synthase n=1 Tax=Cirrhinus molitorella TaxID=172907 RepID=A0ABR3MCU3_9TELE